MLRGLFNYLANKWPMQAAKAFEAHHVVPVRNLPVKSQEDRLLVNYMWVNSHKTEMDTENPTCALNLGNIKRAIDNANRYPQADFRILIDKQLLDEYSQFVLEQFIDEFANTGNIKVHDLQDIKDYAEDPYFVPLTSGQKGFLKDAFSRSGDRNVYSRADLGRILVLDHCMQTEPARSRVIYSDIDCMDIRLGEVLPLLDKHGVAIHNLGSHCVSHGYIALATDNEDVKKYMPFLKADSIQTAHRNELGFTAFESFLNRLEMPNQDWHDVIGLDNLLPEMHTAPIRVDYTPRARFVPCENTRIAAQTPMQQRGRVYDVL